MRPFTYVLAIVPVAVAAFSCTGGRGADGNDGTNCAVDQSNGSATITCSDGTTATVADGAVGPAGTNGKNGANGANGVDGETGATGTDGLTSLIKLTDEPAGINCSAGGTKVQSGQDINNNGILDANEVEATKYICTGIKGANAIPSLILTGKEPAGVNCLDGGVIIQTGPDSNSNGVLDPLEIAQTQYLCKTACTVNRRTVAVPSVEHASLDYVSSLTFDDNVLHVQTDATHDTVGWLGFDLSALPSNGVVLAATLSLRHDPALSTNSGNPIIQVIGGTANHFTRTSVTTTNMPQGPDVSAPISAISVDAWNAVPITLAPPQFATDRSDGYLTLGIADASTGDSLVSFYGSMDASTRPYVEFDVVTCD